VADDLKANARYIGEFGDYVNYHVHADVGAAASQASGYGCVKDGFTGLLLPLQPAMDRLSQLVDQAGNIMGQKMTGTYQGLYATANDYAGMDANNAGNLTASAGYAPPGGSFGGFVQPAGAGTFADTTKVELKPPTVEQTNLGDVLKDGDRWAGDAINWVVRNFSDQLGLGGKDLYDVLIKPISGTSTGSRPTGRPGSTPAPCSGTRRRTSAETPRSSPVSTGQARPATRSTNTSIWYGSRRSGSPSRPARG
jgi:hypothetical protein